MDNMGGMQRVSLQLVNALHANPTVTVQTRILESQWKSIVWNTARFMTGLYTQLPVLVDRMKPDVVLFSSMVTASLAVPLRKRLHAPLVTINHGQDVTLPNPLYQNVVPRIFKALDGVISVSQATREACIERGMDPGKGVALPNGFVPDPSGIVIPKEDARLLIQSLTSTDITNKKWLLSVGRMVRRKGHAWFIENVLPKLDEDVVYIVLGDGPEMAAVSRLANDRLILLGRQPDAILKAAYAASDVFIMPNIPVPGDMEGFGIVLLEANAAGLPAIGSDLEGIRDVIWDGENGYKVPVADVSAWVERIRQMLLSEAEPQRERALAFVTERFDWNVIASQYIQYLQEVIRRSTPQSV